MEEVMFYNTAEGEELTLMDTDGGIMVEQGAVTYTIPDQQQIQQQVVQGPQQQQVVQQQQPHVENEQHQQQPQVLQPQSRVQNQQQPQQQSQQQVQHQQHGHHQQQQQQSQQQQPTSQLQQVQQQQQQQQQQVQQHVTLQQQQLFSQPPPPPPPPPPPSPQQQQQQQQQQQFILHQPGPQVVVQQQVPQQMLQSGMIQQHSPQHIIMQQQVIPQHQQLVVQQQQQQLVPQKHQPTYILASNQQLGKQQQQPHQLIQYLTQTPPPPPHPQQQQILHQQVTATRGDMTSPDMLRKQQLHAQQQQLRQQQHIRQAQLSGHSQQQQQIVQLSVPQHHQQQQHFQQQQQQGGQQQLIPAQLLHQDGGQQQHTIPVAFIQQTVKSSEGIQYQLRMTPQGGNGGVVGSGTSHVRPHMRNMHQMNVAQSPQAAAHQRQQQQEDQTITNILNTSMQHNNNSNNNNSSATSTTSTIQQQGPTTNNNAGIPHLHTPNNNNSSSNNGSVAAAQQKQPASAAGTAAAPAATTPVQKRQQVPRQRQQRGGRGGVGRGGVVVSAPPPPPPGVGGNNNNMLQRTAGTTQLLVQRPPQQQVQRPQQQMQMMARLPSPAGQHHHHHHHHRMPAPSSTSTTRMRMPGPHHMIRGVPPPSPGPSPGAATPPTRVPRFSQAAMNQHHIVQQQVASEPANSQVPQQGKAEQCPVSNGGPTTTTTEAGSTTAAATPASITNNSDQQQQQTPLVSSADDATGPPTSEESGAAAVSSELQLPSSVPSSTTTAAAATPATTTTSSSPPKKLSLEQYRSKQQQMGRPTTTLQPTRYVQQQQQQQHGAVMSREMLLNAKNKQVLYVMNSNHRPIIGNSLSSQHQVLKLHHDHVQQSATPDSTTSSTTTDANAGNKDQDNKNPRYIAGHQIVCSNCGILGDDFHTCQRCKKQLPKNARVIPTGGNTSSPATPLYLTGAQIIKQDFYGKSGGGRRQDKPNQYGRGNTSKAAPRGRGRGRTRAYDEPEILTLSSDEDDENEASSSTAASAGGKSSSNSGAPSSTVAAAAAGGAVSPGVLGSRRQTLHDKMLALAVKEPIMEPAADEENTDGECSSSCKMDTFDPSGNDEFCQIVCRNVRIGSYRTVPTSGVVFSSSGIRISVTSLLPGSTQNVDVNIDLEDVVKILYHFGKQMPVLFLYLRAESAARIRKKLGMQDPKTNYYEPTGNDETLKRIVIMPERMLDECKNLIKGMYCAKRTLEPGAPNLILNRSASSKETTASSTQRQVPLVLMEELTHDEANTILVTSSPPEVQAVVRQTSKTVNQMAQPSKTLLIYPPPPQKGGISITVDDYQVLEEESFLNDVILDFYLKWLLLTQLSEEQRNKVHLFSTFFYKRLTCKPKKMRRHHPIEDDPKLTAAEKRHSRVKSWTKSVDIFEKDFIIIPINEHAHWFLAIICFPGMRGPVHYETGEPLPADAAASNNQANKRKSGRPRSLRPEQIPIIDDGEWSDRDEAEGDEDELEEDDEDDEDSSGSSSGATAGAPQPSRKKARNVSGELVIPGLGGDESVASSSTNTTSLPMKQPCILIFDSLSGGHRARIVATLRDYLAVEHLKKKGETRPFSRDTMKGACPRVPQQTNYSDCGIYVLQFTESFFQLPLKDYKFPMRTINDWFDQSLVAGKREAIAMLIKKLMNVHNPNNNIKLPEIYFNTAEEREKGGRASCQVEERERVERLALEKSREKTAAVLNASKGKAELAANSNRASLPSSPALHKTLVNNERIPLIGNEEASSENSDRTVTKVKKDDDDEEEKSKEGDSLNCSTVENKTVSNANNDEKNSNKKALPYNVTKVNKPTLIRPLNDYSNNSSNKSQQRSAGGEFKGKKLVLGSIPSVKPFGTSVQSSRTIAVNKSVNSGGIVATYSRSVNSSIAAIQDAYNFDDDDVEDNNNESDSNVKHRASAVGESSSGEGTTVATVQVTCNTSAGAKSMSQPPSTTILNGVLAESSAATTTTTVAVETVVSATSTTNTVDSRISTLSQQPKPNTDKTNITDVAHLTKYPILASSLGNGHNNSLDNKRVTTAAAQNSTVSSNYIVKPKSLEKSDDRVSSSNLIKDTSNRSSNELSDSSEIEDKSLSANGHLNQIIVGEISGKKAVYSEDSSEVFMYLSSEEANSLSQAGSEREEGNSPDLYSDLDVTIGKGSLARSEISTDALDDQSSVEQQSKNEQQNTSISSNSNLCSDALSNPSEGVAVGNVSGGGGGGVSNSSGNSTAPACFKFNERGTSSGRTIAPPKRYLDHSTNQVKRKKKVKTSHVGQR